MPVQLYFFRLYFFCGERTTRVSFTLGAVAAAAATPAANKVAPKARALTFSLPPCGCRATWGETNTAPRGVRQAGFSRSSKCCLCETREAARNASSRRARTLRQNKSGTTPSRITRVTNSGDTSMWGRREVRALCEGVFLKRYRKSLFHFSRNDPKQPNKSNDSCRKHVVARGA